MSIETTITSHQTAERKAPARTHTGVQQAVGGRSIGLGIDAGGTFTDAVLYEWSAQRLVGKSKALTTRWDYAAGIRNALAGLEPDHFPAVKLVALSTTLATNAIIEGDGQRVGMIIMPPYGVLNPDEINYQPMKVIAGQLDIDGSEIVPVDPREVKRVARKMADDDGIKAFAVSGFAGSINPSHELAVKTVIQDETGHAVTCGHELSDLLNFKTRAYTAMFNARLIPRLLKLLQSLEAVLRSFRIEAPILMVKGDGTLMSADAALRRPVETILSGPAASVSGAQHLTGIDDALVVDMGGTTTDTAALEGGTVDISEAGASVGGYRTHVRALAIRTAGLGGDSLIRRDLSDFVIGPRRVAPVAWTALHHTGTAEAFDFVERHMDRFKAGAANAMQLLLLTGELPPDLTPAASRAASLLAERPFTVAELVERTGAAFEGALEIGALEEKGIVTRSGPTPMDLLHFTGRFTAWDRAAAERYLGLLARAAGQEPVEMVEGLLQTITRRMTLELLKRQMDEVTDDPEALHRCPACGALLANLFAGGSRHFTVAVQLKRPIIGIGAPVGYFLPQAAALLNTGLVIPEHADVANAIGAITSRVAVTRRLRVVAAPDRTFAVQGLAGLHRFGSLDGADRFAREALTRLVTEGGLSAGTRSGTVSLAAEDRTLTAQDGTDLFKWRTITARLIGPPDLSLANPTAASGQKRASTAVVQEVPVDDAR